MKVVAYVTGHGYGHAVRAAEVTRALVARGASVRLRSDAPREAFAPLPRGAGLERAAVDPGLVQKGPFAIDDRATLKGLERFAAGLTDAVAAEAQRLRRARADVVVADIAVLGLLAARRAGIPSVLVANFTWDFILGDSELREPRLAAFAGLFAAANRTATLVLVPGLAAGLDPRLPLVVVPLIARRSTRSRASLRRALGLGARTRAVFVAFGGFGPPELRPPRDIDPGRTQFFGYADLGWPEALHRQVDRRRFAHHDLVAACDLVLGKPGYGTVAECAIHRVPMLWMPRERFAEHPFLVRALRHHVGGSELRPEELGQGRLAAAIDRALNTPASKGPLRGGGARLAAARILAVAEKARGLRGSSESPLSRVLNP